MPDVEAIEEEIHTQIQDPVEWDEVQRSYSVMERDEEILFAGSRRRRYHGLRGVFAAVARFFKRVARSIIDAARAIVRGIKDLLRSALQLFRNIIRGIRKGLRVIGLAVKRFHYWLFKKPFITGGDGTPQFVFTRFDWGGDAFQFVNEGTTGRQIRSHHRSIKRMNLAFAIVARLAVKAINLITSAATYNWLRLAWSLMRLVTSSFWKEFKTLVRKYRETFALDVLETAGSLEGILLPT
jgi:hypothetical protein